MKNLTELRTLTTSLELRKAPAGSKSPGTLSGYAAKFGTWSQDLGGFKETIKPGAFKRCLASGADVRCLMNHDPSSVLGRTKSGTLKVSEDSVGLRFTCQLPDTQVARDLYTSISRGDVNQCSFAFKVANNGESWGKDEDSAGNEFVTREISDADLFDVSAVTYPAYLDTNVSATRDDDNPDDEDDDDDDDDDVQFNSVRVSRKALVEARSRQGRTTTRRPYVRQTTSVKEEDARLRMRAATWGKIIQMDAELEEKRKRDRRAQNVRKNYGRHPVRPI